MRIRRVRRTAPRPKPRPKTKPKAPAKVVGGGAGIPMPHKKLTITPRKPIMGGGGSVVKPKPKVRPKPKIRKAVTRKLTGRRRTY